jgi:beta-N-acetylhexosaminidase
MKNIDSEELKERIGQMIISGFKGRNISEDSRIVKMIKDVKPGGLILYRQNISNPEQVQELISGLQYFSSIPLFVVVDAEGGKLNRLKSKQGFFDIPSHKELGKIQNYDVTKQEALKLSQELRNLGFNMNFAPVVDVDINPKNPIIGALGRSFSANPFEVALHAQAFIEAHRENNIIAVAKHFPGHGSSKKDSHIWKVDVTDTYQEEELFPYKFLQERGLLDAAMTAHIINRKIDKDSPATLSAKFLQDILRNQIGFQGVIVSDDMRMWAISRHYNFKDSLIKAINAGCDIILVSNNNLFNPDRELPYKIFNIIYSAVKEGKISEQRIIESSNRIYELKKRFKIIQNP